MNATTSDRLSDGRPIRVDRNMIRQLDLFQLRGKFDPKTEHIAKLKDLDDALNVSLLQSVERIRLRSDEYGLFHKSGKPAYDYLLLWVENGIGYRFFIPDIPVKFDGKEISLRKAIFDMGGLGIFPSIDLLKITQEGERIYNVEPVDLAAIAGKVRVIKLHSDPAEMDEFGFPDKNKPTSSYDNPKARYFYIDAIYEELTNGWHGSFYRCSIDDNGNDARRQIMVAKQSSWGAYWHVPFVGHEMTPPPLEAVQEPGRLVLSGSDEHIQAAMKALKSQNLI